MLAAAVAAAQDKQAVDLRVLELDPAESSLTDFFLVMSGTNTRQIQTLADEIELRMKRDFGQLPNSREGYRQAEWILLDYVDFVVHIFSEEKRAYYGLERLRKSAVSRDPASVRAAQRVSKPAVSESAKKQSARKRPARKRLAKNRLARRRLAARRVRRPLKNPRRRLRPREESAVERRCASCWPACPRAAKANWLRWIK